jgi:hypothetical protein
MRKLLPTLFFVIMPAMAINGTSANALECYVRPYSPGILDCYS